MKPIRDSNIAGLIERIGEHYRANIANRFIRPALLQLAVDKLTWDQLETLTEKFDQFQYQGFQLDELYRQIAAAGRFVSTARRESTASLKNRLGSSATSSDKVLRDMAITTFTSNVQVMAGLLNELYQSLVEIDKVAAKGGRKPLYTQMRELADIESMLTGNA